MKGVTGRRGVAVLVVGACCAVAAGSSALGGRSQSPAGSNRWLVDVVIALIVAFSVLGLTVAAVLFWPRRGSREVARPTRSLKSMVLAYLQPLAVLLIVMWLVRSRRADDERSALVTLAPDVSRPVAPDAVSTPVDVWPAVLVGALIAAGVIVWFLLPERRRSRPLIEADAEPVVDLAEAARVGLDALDADGDPRQVVIATYARLEYLFDQAGHGRRPAEAPFEHLQRVLAGSGVSADTARRLVTLFEYAKFAPHPVDATMRAQALDALGRLRDELVPA